jgi:hypothetical protein
MTDEVKRKSLIYVLLLITAVILIAADLPQLVFKTGIPLPGQQNEFQFSATESVPLASISINTYFKALMGVILILVVAYSSYQLIKGVSLRDILRPSLMIAGFTLIALFILFAIAHVNVSIGPIEKEVLPPDIIRIGEPLAPTPPILIWLVWIGLIISTGLLGIWLIQWRANRNLADDPLEREAYRAVQALRLGLDLRNVILRCYRQMSQALQKEQGIALEETMTAREFERLLEARGIPRSPVQQLTQLFETARYGCQPPTPGDEEKAVDCLKAIIQSSRALRQGR